MEHESATVPLSFVCSQLLRRVLISKLDIKLKIHESVKLKGIGDYGGR